MSVTTPSNRSTYHPNRRRWRTLVAALSITLFATAATVGAADGTDVDAALRAAIGGPQRNDANRARDPARHPYETLRFFDLIPGQTVVEIAPGGGWYTEIFAPYLRGSGRPYVATPAADDPSTDVHRGRARFVEKLSHNPEVYDRVRVVDLPGTVGFGAALPTAQADRVLTFRNIHTWIEDGSLYEKLQAFFAVLKPSGLLGIEEHRAPPGTPQERVLATGYVPVELVVAHARAAGFEWVGESEVNANPRDMEDHAGGVWALPPTLRNGTVDRDRYLAIGESDRMTLKFRRPPR